MIQYLNFIHTTVRFDIAEDAIGTFKPIRGFFRHVMSDHGAREPTFSITVLPYDPARDVEAAVWDIPRTVIRKSNAAEFNFTAHVIGREGRKVYVNRRTLIDTPADARADGAFLVRITPGSVIQVVDFVRDLVIRNEEDHGTVVLHASAVHRDGEAIAIAGPKGAGKTTTLLSALRRGSWEYFTGDKLFCVVDNTDIRVYPWRDYPHVGVGTIRSDRGLLALVRERVDPGIDAYAPDRKILIEPELFESWLRADFTAEPKRLTAILLPEVRPGEPLEVRALASERERWAYLNKIIDRQADTSFFTWHDYLVPDYVSFFRTLADIRLVIPSVEMVRLTGTLDVDPEAILRASRLSASLDES